MATKRGRPRKRLPAPGKRTPIPSEPERDTFTLTWTGKFGAIEVEYDNRPPHCILERRLILPTLEGCKRCNNGMGFRRGGVTKFYDSEGAVTGHTFIADKPCRACWEEQIKRLTREYFTRAHNPHFRELWEVSDEADRHKRKLMLLEARRRDARDAMARCDYNGALIHWQWVDKESGGDEEAREAIKAVGAIAKQVKHHFSVFSAHLSDQTLDTSRKALEAVRDLWPAADVLPEMIRMLEAAEKQAELRREVDQKINTLKLGKKGALREGLLRMTRTGDLPLNPELRGRLKTLLEADEP